MRSSLPAASVRSTHRARPLPHTDYGVAHECMRAAERRLMSFGMAGIGGIVQRPGDGPLGRHAAVRSGTLHLARYQRDGARLGGSLPPSRYAVKLRLCARRPHRLPLSGWQYDTHGQCRFIPAHPDLDVPATIDVATYTCTERLGMLWVYSDREVETPPDLPIGPREILPVRSLYVGCKPAAVIQALAARSKNMVRRA